MASPPTIRVGHDGTWVARVQRALDELGMLRHTGADGLYGPGTKTDVRAYQAGRGLAADGIVGPATWAALGIEDGDDGWTFAGLAVRTLPIAGVMLHHTVTHSTQRTIDVLRDRGLSTGYIIGPDGVVLHCCPDDRIAVHASGYSARYVGVDIVNPLDVDIDGATHWQRIGRHDFAPTADGHRYRRDTAAAVTSAYALCARLATQHGFGLHWQASYPPSGGTVPTDLLDGCGVLAHGQVSATRWDGHAMLREWDGLRCISTGGSW